MSIEKQNTTESPVQPSVMPKPKFLWFEVLALAITVYCIASGFFHLRIG